MGSRLGLGLGVAIVGCGLIGAKRARSLGSAHVAVVADLLRDRASKLASEHGARVCDDFQSAVTHPEVDLVIVATSNDALTPVAKAAMKAGKHVLVEKPGARSSAEIQELCDLAAGSQVLVRVGFNHRYHPAIRKARELFESGVLGKLMFIRGRYGHGGRLGYEKEWRADPAISGGGELIDQGVHMIDLARWFLGDFSDIVGFAATYFWDMPVEDNGFLLLRTPDRQTAFLHVSWTEWKNLFSLEIYGRDAKLAVEGLGGSYGAERLTYYKMLPEMGPPEATTWEFLEEDDSWAVEFQAFMDDIRLGRAPQPGPADARAALAIVEQVYAESKR